MNKLKTFTWSYVDVSLQIGNSIYVYINLIVRKVDLVAGSQTLLDVDRQLILQTTRSHLSTLSSYDNLLVLTSEKPNWLRLSVYPWWTLLYAVINNNQTDMEDVREKWGGGLERKVRFYLYLNNLLFESALLYRIQGIFLLTSTLWLSQESRYMVTGQLVNRWGHTIAWIRQAH